MCAQVDAPSKITSNPPRIAARHLSALIRAKNQTLLRAVPRMPAHRNAEAHNKAFSTSPLLNNQAEPLAAFYQFTASIQSQGTSSASPGSGYPVPAL